MTLYVFDRQLRLLVLDVIERIEVAVRAQVSNHMAIANGNDPFWYLHESHFKSDYPHDRFLADIERQLDDERRHLDNNERQVDKRNNLTSAQKAALKDRLRKENFLKRLYSVLVALQSMLYTINPSLHWAQRLQKLMHCYPRVSLAHMGMPVDWSADPFWRDAFSA